MGIQQALVGRLGHPSGHQIGQVDLVRDGLDLQNLIRGALRPEYIGAIRALSGGDAVALRHGVHVIGVKSQGRDQPQIIEGGVLQIGGGGAGHVRPGHLQSGEEG